MLFYRLVDAFLSVLNSFLLFKWIIRRRSLSNTIRKIHKAVCEHIRLNYTKESVKNTYLTHG